METMGSNPFGEPINQLLQWETWLQKTRILGLLDLPHFGRGHYTTLRVKQLLAVMHGGDRWLDKLVLIDIELMSSIIGLPSWGMDPVQFLDEKYREKSLE
jgi:hypothetical protein